VVRLLRKTQPLNVERLTFHVFGRSNGGESMEAVAWPFP
jgi:hypothetical protein